MPHTTVQPNTKEAINKAFSLGLILEETRQELLERLEISKEAA